MRSKKLARERNGALTEVERQAREAQLALASEILRIENADFADAISPRCSTGPT
jgi:hypothetical protein